MSDLADVLSAGQVLAESLMVDTGSAKRPTGGTSQDANTGTVTPTYSALFSSKCKIQAGQLAVIEEEAGGRTVAVERLQLHLPVGTADLQTGDLWTISAAGAGSRSRVGRMVRVLGPADKTYLTALRYQVEEYVS